jgi:nucleoside phosphorylase
MEAFGFYTMCQAHQIPFISIRGVSDNGETHAGVTFEQNLALAAQAAARATLTYLQAS